MVGSTFSSPDVESDDGDFPTHSPLLSGESYFSICVGSLFSQESKSCLNWLKAPAPVLKLTTTYVLLAVDITIPVTVTGCYMQLFLSSQLGLCGLNPNNRSQMPHI